MGRYAQARRRGTPAASAGLPPIEFGVGAVTSGDQTQEVTWDASRDPLDEWMIEVEQLVESAWVPLVNGTAYPGDRMAGYTENVSYVELRARISYVENSVQSAWSDWAYSTP